MTDRVVNNGQPSCVDVVKYYRLTTIWQCASIANTRPSRRSERSGEKNRTGLLEKWIRPAGHSD